MSTNPDSNPVFEVKPGDVTITESGGVEIVNLNLAEALRSVVETQARLGKGSGEGTNWLLCHLNWKCGKEGESPASGSATGRT
ncbi:MAG TPA: hypothetical protein VMW27_15595 [Thermoanaerobaculia bacterium]|nr:hypothetical protein [Thermoanaerobaculia bacterium]